MLKINEKYILYLSSFTTLLSIYATSYSFIYKASFFENLGLDWYLQTISLQSIIISCIKITFITGISILSAFIIYKEIFKGLLKEDYGYSFLLWLTGTFIAIPLTSKLSLKYIELSILSFSTISFVIYILITKADQKNQEQAIRSNTQRNINNYLNKAGIIIGIIGIIVVPIKIAEAKADLIKKDPEKYLPETSIKTMKNTKWYILDISNSNALLLKVEKEKVLYRVIELKELEEIKSNSSDNNR